MTLDVKQETARGRETASPKDVIKRDARQDKQPYATEAEAYQPDAIRKDIGARPGASAPSKDSKEEG